jgi:O-antigen/teichoic acid export membrane protein
MLLNLLINPLVALNMDPEDFAIVGYFTSFSTLIGPIITFYMLHYYNKRYFELDEFGREHLRALLYKALIFFSFGVTLVCLLILAICINHMANTDFNTFPYLYLAVMSIPFTGIYNLELADYKMKKESKPYLYLSLIKGVGGVVLILLFVVIFKWGAVGKLSAALLIEILVFIYLLYKHVDVWKIKTSLRELIPVLKFCWPLALGAALGYFSSGYDKLILKSLNNVEEFGYYCVGSSIAAYLGVFTSSISATFQPDTYESVIREDRRRFFNVVSIRLILTLFVVLLFVLLCPFLVKVLTAGKYMESVPYASITAFVALTSSLYYIINDYSIARGRPQLYLITTILGSAIVILLMPLFVRHFNFEGAALMNVLSFVVLFAINLILLFFTGKR